MRRAVLLCAAAATVLASSVATEYPCFNFATNKQDTCSWDSTSKLGSAGAGTAAAGYSHDDSHDKTCEPGWWAYLDENKSEKQKSCLQEMEFPDSDETLKFGGSWNYAKALCEKSRKGAHLVTVKSKAAYTPGGPGLLSQLIDNLHLRPVGYMGCHQKWDSPIGEGNTGKNWEWVDKTSSKNLKCSDPGSGSCPGTGVWSYNTMGQFPAEFPVCTQISNCTGGPPSSTGDASGFDLGGEVESTVGFEGQLTYDEEHRMDYCAYVFPGEGFLAPTSGGIMSMLNNFVYGFTCEYENNKLEAVVDPCQGDCSPPCPPCPI